MTIASDLAFRNYSSSRMGTSPISTYAELRTRSFDPAGITEPDIWHFETLNQEEIFIISDSLPL